LPAPHDVCIFSTIGACANTAGAASVPATAPPPNAARFRNERRFILGLSVINNPPKTRQGCIAAHKLPKQQITRDRRFGEISLPIQTFK
jgi:hypothetical protein